MVKELAPSSQCFHEYTDNLAREQKRKKHSAKTPNLPGPCQFTCMQPKPAQTRFVKRTQTISELQKRK